MSCRSNIPELFAQRWGSVLKEYAVRYGDKVKGWWVDGCYECTPALAAKTACRLSAGPRLALPCPYPHTLSHAPLEL